jgi:HSP20 family protein
MDVVTKEQNAPAEVAAQSQRQVRYVTPLADVDSADEGYTIRAEMPGVNKSNLEITVDNGELTLVGHRQVEAEPGEPVYREIRPVDYRRVYELDPTIDTTKISARIEDGVLTVTLPKAESVKPRKITVE